MPYCSTRRLDAQAAARQKDGSKITTLILLKRISSPTCFLKLRSNILLSRCENGTEDIISTRSKAYLTLKEEIDEMSLTQLTRFIQRNPSVLKRPIMLSEKNMVVGYDDDEITAMIPVSRRKEELRQIERSILESTLELRTF